MREAREGF